jgi:hypothetical protein
MATNTIGKLVVTLGANSAQLMSELKKTKKHTRDWSSDMKSVAKFSAASFAAVSVAAGGAAVGVIALVEANSDAIDSLGKTADKLGVTTEALQILRYQGELTGVAISTTDMALQRMTRRTAEAAQGTGEAKDAIKELGLNAEELARLSPDQQFYAIAEAMKEVESQGDRVRLAMKLFDSEGVALVNTLVSDLDAAEQKFESLGATITRQQVAMVEGYNDAKKDLDYLFGSFGQKLTVYLAGPFEEVLRYIEYTAVEMGGMDGVASATAITIIDAFSGVVELFAILTGNIDNARIALLSLSSEWAATKQWAGQSLSGLGIDFGDELDAAGAQQLQDNIAAKLDILQNQQGLEERVKSIQDLADRMRQSVKDAINLPDNSLPVESAPTFAGVSSPNQSEYMDLLAQYDKNASIQKKYQSQVDEINKANITAAQKEQLLTKALKERDKALRDLTLSQRSYGAEIKNTQNTLSQQVNGQNSSDISLQFQRYANAYQKASFTGEGDTGYFITRMEEVLKGIAKSGNIGTYDFDAMVQYLDQIKDGEGSAAIIASQDEVTDALTKLVAEITKLNGNLANGSIGGSGPGQSLGSIEFNIMSDGKKLSGILMGEPDFLRRLKQFNEQYTQSSARAAVR